MRRQCFYYLLFRTQPKYESPQPCPARCALRLIGLMFVGLVCSSTLAHGAIVRVGNGEGCDTSSVQQGIDIAMAQPGTDTVQLAEGNFFEAASIDGAISSDVIVIKGGHEGCSDTHNSAATGLFSPSTSMPALQITGGAAVIISHMQLTNDGGLALALRSPNTDVTLESATIAGSTLGVTVRNGAALVVDGQSRVINNHSTTGPAGILCGTAAGATPQVFVRGAVIANSAVSGAGIWAGDGCRVTLAGAQFRSNEATNGGGAIYLEQGAQLTSIDAGVTEFSHNSAERGGAIYATDATTTVELDKASVHNNQATRGGGIYAQTNALVTIAGGVEIFDNIATREGGGVAAYAGSRIVLRDGVRVYDNSATDHGGGFYLATSADLHGSADGSRGIEIRGNDAAYGGGLYLTGDGTEAFLFNYHVRGNQARFAGGGIAVRFGAFLEMNRGNSIQCANPPRCSVLSENVLTLGTDGSALYIDNGASAKLYQTYIEQNRHQTPAAASRVVQTRGDGTTLRLEGIQMWKNDATYLIGANDSSSIEAGFITAARNFWTLDETTALPVLGGVTGAGGSLTLASSILVDTRGYTGTSIFTDCLIVDDASGLATSMTVQVGDPLLVAPSSGNLRLRGDSPAIDYCNADFFAPEDPLDLDLDARGVDHPEVPSGLGLYDLGMDETLDSPPLFADGFESGDTSAWSGEV